jgi:DnaJ like chaperone protein
MNHSRSTFAPPLLYGTGGGRVHACLLPFLPPVRYFVAMSIWTRIGEFVSLVSDRALPGLIEAVRTMFEGDPETRRRVAFSVAMIALSAKMAKADGIVTQSEVRAFSQIFEVPKGDVAGFEAYARQMASLCGSGAPNCAVLEDILDGLFHIAKADGVLHDKELAFLRRVAEIFDFDEVHFNRILARHAAGRDPDPWLVLGLEPGSGLAEVRRRYRQLVAENHPDRLIARGVPEEFHAIANERLAAINAAYATLSARLKRK